MDLLINAANVLYVIAYFTTDMLRLRILTLAAASCLAIYFASLPGTPLDRGRLERVLPRAEPDPAHEAGCASAAGDEGGPAAQRFNSM